MFFSEHSVVFSYQTGWQYSDGDLLTGASSATGGMKKSRFSTNISLYLEMMQDRAIVTKEGE